MDRRGGLIAAVVLGLLGAALWLGSGDDDPPGRRGSAPVPSTAPLGPLPLESDVVEVPLPDPGSAVDRALDRLADLEGATRLRCPDPGFVVARSPFLHLVPRGDHLDVLVGEPRGEGLVYGEPEPGGPPLGLAGPEARAWWDAETGACRFDEVPLGEVRGVVADRGATLASTWVVGCGAPMEPVDARGHFVLEVPVGEPCRLQAEGRGDGVWVVPVAGETIEVVVPWIPPRGGERDEVALRLREQLDALDALEGQPDPLQEALDGALDDDVREVLTAWRDDAERLQEGRRRWLEAALRRYEAPPPPVDLDGPDVWPEE